MTVQAGAISDAAGELRRGATRLARRLRLEGPVDGLSSLKLSILAHLQRYGPMRPGELAALERLQPQSLTRVLAELTEEGFVTRTAEPMDRRKSTIDATEPGLAILERDIAQRDAWLGGAMSSALTNTEREVLRLAGALMDRLSDTPFTTTLSVPAHGVDATTRGTGETS